MGVLDKYGRRELSNSKVFMDEFLKETSQLKDFGALEIISVDDKVIVDSIQYLVKHHLYLADALQIVSCRGASCDVFVTADEMLSRAAKREGLRSVYVK